MLHAVSSDAVRTTSSWSWPARCYMRKSVVTGEVRAAVDQADVDQRVSAFFEYGFIQWVDVDLVIAREARRLSRAYRLRGADAIHLASAIRASCDVLMTWNKNDFPVGQHVDGVDIREPFLFGQGNLEDEIPALGQE